MPNPFSKLKIRNVIYDVKDAIARSSIGNLSELQTEHKDNLVDAINDAAQSGGGSDEVSPYTQNPSSLGQANPGSVNQYARGDHIHPMPTASDIGAVSNSQGIENANKILGIDNTGVVVPMEGGSDFSSSVKSALLQIARNIAYIDTNGQIYYNALYDALYPPSGLVSITAVFTQGTNTIYDTDSLDVLRQYLVVTALYEDTTTSTISNYALAGTLTTGTSVITVTYGGKTTTFNVTVTHDTGERWDYTWEYTDGLPPSSDWTWATQSGGGQVHEIISDGMLMTAKSGTTGRYYMPYAPTSIVAAGGCIVQCSLYIPSSLINTKNWYFDVTATDGTNQLIVKFIHIQGGDDCIALHAVGASTYSGTILSGFTADTVVTVKMIVNCSTHLADVYIDNVLKASNIDLTTFAADTEVRMRVTGWGNVGSDGAGAVVQSFKIKYGLS